MLKMSGNPSFVMMRVLELLMCGVSGEGVYFHILTKYHALLDAPVISGYILYMMCC